MPPKIDPGNKRKIIWNNWKILRISQECKVLKPQEPCFRWGAVYIYTNQQVSKPFSNISKKVIKLMLKVIPKWSKNHLKINQENDAEKIEKYYSKYAQLSDCGSHFGASCLIVSQSGAFVCDLFVGTSGGYPLGPILATPGEHLVRFCRLFGRLK